MPSTASSDRESVYTVVAVRYGTLVGARSDMFLNHRDYGEPDAPARLDYYFWVIEGAGRTILFDTGFDAEVGRRRGRTVHVDPRVALDALGIVDEEETLVVLSHAHYDHIGNVSHFRRAEMVMDEAEYDFWVERPRRLRLTEQLTEPAELDALRAARAAGRLRLIDSDSELAPGVRILAGRGHTPGQLMLLVGTESGGILLTADAVHLDEELSRRMPFRHMCDLVASVDTYQAIEELRGSGQIDRVVAGHEPDLTGPVDARLPEHTLVLSSTRNR